MNIRELLIQAKMSQQKLSDATGIPTNRIAQWSSGRASPKYEDRVTLIEFFSKKLEIPAEVLAGLDNAEEIVAAIDIVRTSGFTTFTKLGGGYTKVEMPLVPTRAYAGYVAGWSDDSPPDVADFDKFTVTMKDPSIGSYMAFEVKGDSMDDGSRNSITEGAVVSGRELDKKYWNSRFHLHKYTNYVIVTEDGIYIKEITEHHVAEGIVVCRSLNPDKETYPDFELELRNVKQLFYVKAVTNLVK